MADLLDMPLSQIHIVLVRVEDELRRSGRRDDANAVAMADLIVLNLRVFVSKRQRRFREAQVGQK